MPDIDTTPTIATTVAFTIEGDTVNGIKLNNTERALLDYVSVREDVNDVTLMAKVQPADSVGSSAVMDALLGLRHTLDSTTNTVQFEAFSAKRFTRRLVRIAPAININEVDTDRLTEVLRRARNGVHRQLVMSSVLESFNGNDDAIIPDDDIRF